jgi:hypothetical protein
MRDMKPRATTPDAMLRDHLHDELQLRPVKDRRREGTAPRPTSSTSDDQEDPAPAEAHDGTPPNAPTSSGTRRAQRSTRGRSSVVESRDLPRDQRFGRNAGQGFDAEGEMQRGLTLTRGPLADGRAGNADLVGERLLRVARLLKVITQRFVFPWHATEISKSLTSRQRFS